MMILHRELKQWRRWHEDNSKKKNEFILWAEFRNICSVHMSVMKLSQAKYVTPPFILKKKIEKLAAVIHVLWNTQNLIVIARSCFTENGKKMHKDL